MSDWLTQIHMSSISFSETNCVGNLVDNIRKEQFFLPMWTQSLARNKENFHPAPLIILLFFFFFLFFILFFSLVVCFFTTHMDMILLPTLQLALIRAFALFGVISNSARSHMRVRRQKLKLRWFNSKSECGKFIERKVNIANGCYLHIIVSMQFLKFRVVFCVVVVVLRWRKWEFIRWKLIIILCASGYQKWIEWIRGIERRCTNVFDVVVSFFTMEIIKLVSSSFSSAFIFLSFIQKIFFCLQFCLTTVSSTDDENFK